MDVSIFYLVADRKRPPIDVVHLGWCCKLPFTHNERDISI